MDILNGKQLRQQAAQRLDYAAYNPKMLTLIHGGVLLAGSFIIILLNLLLDHFIKDTGGLSGIGTRNILETVSSLASLAYTFAAPFWQVGVVFAFLCVARKQYADGHSLLRGFGRIGSVLAMLLLEFGLYIALAIGVSYVATFLAMPFCDDLMTLMMPVMTALEQDPSADMYALIMQLPAMQLLDAALPLLIIFSVLYLALGVFFFYRLRFAPYIVLDEYRMGGFASLRLSFRMTKGHCISLFKLDLGFWKYYLLLMLVSCISLAGDWLPQLGAPAPFNAYWFSLLLYGIYAAAALLLDWHMRPMVETTYALAYDKIKNPPLAVVDQMR